MTHDECHSNSCCSSEHAHSEECCSHDHCSCDCHKKNKYCHQLLELADEAWMELLKEEIKKVILQTTGEHLKKMAELISKTNHKRWSEKMEEKQNIESFEEELKKLRNNKNK